MNRHLIVLTAALGAMAIAGHAQTSQPTSAPMSMPTSQPTTMAGFAEPMEAAHGMDQWQAEPAIEFDAMVIFRGNTSLDGHVLYDYHSGRVRITRSDGTVLIFDGNEAYVSPADAEANIPRFQLLTWPYFFAVPFKLSDPGNHLGEEMMRPLRGEEVPTARLTFDAGVGDAPDDWYIIYRDPETNLLSAVAYIVTYFSQGATGEESVHAATYDSFADVDGAMVPTTMSFLHWSEEEGPHGDPIGSAVFSNIQFVTPVADAFDAPANSRIAPLPSAQ